MEDMARVPGKAQSRGLGLGLGCLLWTALAILGGVGAWIYLAWEPTPETRLQPGLAWGAALILFLMVFFIVASREKK